jgi:hypothetical protein
MTCRRTVPSQPITSLLNDGHHVIIKLRSIQYVCTGTTAYSSLRWHMMVLFWRECSACTTAYSSYLSFLQAEKFNWLAQIPHVLNWYTSYHIISAFFASVAQSRFVSLPSPLDFISSYSRTFYRAIPKHRL